MRLAQPRCLKSYICAACHRRIPQKQLVRRQSTVPVTRKEDPARNLDNAVAVEQRIQELGGYGVLHQRFPRLEPENAVPVVSAAVASSARFLEQRLSKADNEITVYGVWK